MRLPVPFYFERCSNGHLNLEKLRTGIRYRRKSLEKEGWGFGKGGKSVGVLPPFFRKAFPSLPQFSLVLAKSEVLV